jgi:hypothetical protein
MSPYYKFTKPKVTILVIKSEILKNNGRLL